MRQWYCLEWCTVAETWIILFLLVIYTLYFAGLCRKGKNGCCTAFVREGNWKRIIIISIFFNPGIIHAPPGHHTWGTQVSTTCVVPYWSYTSLVDGLLKEGYSVFLLLFLKICWTELLTGIVLHSMCLWTIIKEGENIKANDILSTMRSN